MVVVVPAVTLDGPDDPLKPGGGLAVVGHVCTAEPAKFARQQRSES
jgi:hypothetical protein